MIEIERALVDYFESASVKVTFDGSEWWALIDDDGNMISLTGAATAALEALQKAQASFSGEEGKSE